MLLTDCSSQRLTVVMISSQYVYEVRPGKDHRGVDLISDASVYKEVDKERSSVNRAQIARSK